MKQLFFFIFIGFLFITNSHAQDVSIQVMIAGFNSNGVAYIQLYKEGEKFDIDSKTCKKIKINIENKVCSYKFTGLKKGTYGIMVFHDENTNGKLDSNIIGIPKEGVGNSNNHSGIPNFKKSSFTVNENKKIRILMHYIFE